MKGDPYYIVVESLTGFLSQLCGRHLHDKFGYLARKCPRKLLNMPPDSFVLFIVKYKRKQTEDELPNKKGTTTDDLQSLQPLQMVKMLILRNDF